MITQEAPAPVVPLEQFYQQVPAAAEYDTVDPALQAANDLEALAEAVRIASHIMPHVVSGPFVSGRVSMHEAGERVGQDFSGQQLNRTAAYTLFQDMLAHRRSEEFRREEEKKKGTNA